MPDDIAEEIAARRREQNDQQQATPLSVTPPPTVANGGIDPVADSIASRRKVALASSITAGMPANPDTRARAMALAEQMRFPVDVVERNLPAVEEKARRSKYDLDAIRKNHPELAEWLTNPNNAAVSNDDLPAMRAIDVATRALRGEDPAGVLPPGFLFSGGAIVEPLGDGSLANEYKTVQDLQKELTRRGERHDWAEWERQQKAQELKDRWGPLAVAGGGAEASVISTLRAVNFGGRERSEYLDRMGDQSAQASATLDPSIWGDFQRGLGGVAADLPLMFSGGPIVKGLQSLTRIGRARSLVGALEKATPANRAAGGAFANLSAERGAAKAALAEAEAGALLTGRAADIAKTALAVQPLAIREGVNSAEDNGVANGAMSWLIETAIPGAFGRTGLERAIVPGATDVAAKGWRGVVAQGLKDAGYEATEEAITEWAHAVHEAASGIDPQALDPDRLGRRLLVAGAVGGVAGGVTQIPTAIAEKLYGDQEEARRATVHADRLTTLAKSIAASKTNDRAAPVVKEAIEKSLGQSDRFQYVDANDFREAFDDPAAAASAMGLAKEYAEALAARTPLKIPTATLVQSAAKDAGAAKLIGKARRSPDAWHAEQAAEFSEKAPDEVRRLQNEAKASAANVATTPADAVAKVEQGIEAKLIKAGHDPVRAKTNAKLMANTFATFAKRSSKDAGELFQQYLDGNIKKVLPQLLKGEKFDLVDSMLDRIRTGEVPSDKEINGPSLVDYLRDKGLRDTSLAGELKQLKESDRTRLPGERSLIRDDGITLDEARELAVDRGYLPEGASLNDFMTALDNEIRGNSPSYVEGNGDPNKRAVRDSLDRMAEALSAAGVDPLTATNKQAREALAKMMEEQDGKGYEQTDPTAAPMADTIEVDGKQRPTLNSDGKRIAKDEESVRNFWRWFGDSKVVDADGRPLVVYHGTKASFDAFKPSPVGMVGGGIYLTPNKSDAGSYATSADGSRVVPLYARITNPKTFKDAKGGVDDFFRSISNYQGQDADAEVTRRNVAAGYDGVTVGDGKGGTRELVAFDPTQVKSATGNRGTFDGSDPKIYNQGAVVDAPRSGRLDLDALLKQWRKATGDRTPIGGDAAFQALAEESDEVDAANGKQYNQPATKNLLVQHNLTAENLLHADKLGGIPVPSLAVARKEHPLTGFGEITLLAPSSILESDKARTFDADIYSPRYPQVNAKVDNKELRAAWRMLGKASVDLGHVLSSELEEDNIQKDGIGAFRKSSAAGLTYLRERGTDIVLPKKKTESSYLADSPELVPFVKKMESGDSSVEDSKEFRDAYDNAINKVLAQYKAAGIEDADETRDQFYTSDGSPSYRIVNQMREEMGLADRPTVDRYAAERLIEEEVAKVEGEFLEWIRENFASTIKGEEIVVRSENSWNAKRIPHTLENVVKVLTKKVRDGEGFNYGVGNLRANLAKEFRSVKSVQKDRDRIVSHKEMEEVKKEANDELHQLASDLGATGFGSLGALAENLKETAERGPSVLSKYYPDVTDDLKRRAVEYLAKLKNLPTEYFETKIGRAVDLGEFTAAVVPEGTNPKAVKALEGKGVKVTTYKKGDEQSRSEAIAQASDKAGILFQPKNGKGPRGSLVFGKTGTPFTIKLFQSESLSTFAHESAHLSLEILSDLATAEGAAPDLVDDFRKVREWFKTNAKDIRKQARDLAKDRGAPAHVITNGIENLTDEQIAAIAEDFVSAPADGTAGSYVHEAMHEYFARGWEGYLLEGKAPTASLRSVFARVKGWMTAIYKIVTTLRVNLSPEIRGVFDRLVAIEDETDAAEDRAGTKDILPPDAFPDLPTFDAYRTAVQASHDAAEASLQRQLIADYTKEWKKAQTEQREEIREEVAAEVNAQPVYQAIAALQRAQLPEGGQVDAYVGLKLDREELVREWGEAALSKLPGPGSRANSGAYMYAKEGGASIATVAQTFGFSDPSAMIEAMIAAPDRVSLIETQTEKRMRAEHPDPLLDGSLPDRATAAIHGDERAELLARELRALGMKTGQTPAPVAVLREFARSTIEKQLARDLRPAIYKAAAATANRRAIEAAAKQDWGTAYVEKQREALNLEMYRASRDAVEAGEKSRDYLRSLNTLAARQRIGKAGGWEFTVFDQDGAEVATYPTVEEARAAVLPGQSFRQTNGYLEQIDAIQDGYSLRRTSNRKLRKGERMRKWMAEQQKDDPEFEIDGRIMSDLDVGNVNWNDLTVQDQATVVDAVRAIENQAKLKNKLLKAKEVRDLAAAQEMGARSILANKKGNAPKSQQGDTVLESGARSGKGFLGWHRKDSFLIHAMDGYQNAGAMWELIQRPRNDAATDEEARNLVNAAAVEAIFKKWGKGLGWTRQEIAGTKLRLTLEHRIAMALNWGHAEGRRRILRQLEADGMDQRDVQAVLDSLDAKDFAMVDELVALINSHWSDVAHLEQRLNGIPPEKVKALPWSTRDPVTGKTTWHQGGYYPLKYDAEKSKRAGDAAAAAALKENASAAGAKGYTRRSHTKQRAEDVKGLVVDLSLDVAGRHLAEVVHDLTHREMVRDQLRLLKEGTPIAEAIIQKHGIAKWKQLVETTGAIATRDVQPDNKAARFVRMVRRGNTAATFTYQLASALMNLTGVLSSVARVGPLRLISAAGSVLKDAATMEWAGTWVQGKSDTMRVRGGNNVREVSEALRDVGHLSGLQKAIRIGYIPMQKVVQLVDTITWIAAYRQHMDVALKQGKTESEADEQAIAVADQTVIDTQGSGRIGDLSAIQRGGELAKLFTMFYGYFNVQANLIGEQYGKAREEGGAQWIKSATVVLMLGPVATILTNLIKAALRGDERKEDAEEMAKRMALEQLGTAAGMLVGVREVSGAIESGFGYGGPASLSAIGNATKLIQDIKQGDLDGIAKGAISTVGSLTGAPSRVANQVLDAFLQFEEDGKGGRALRTMLFGKPLKDHK